MEKKERKATKTFKIQNIILAFAFSFNLCLFAPMEFYYLNMFDFWFVSKDFIFFVLLMFFAVFIIDLIILQLFGDKKNSICTKINLSLFVALYIQGNFLNFGYGTIDGSTVDWKSMIGKGIINTLIWIMIFVIPFIIKPLKNSEILKKVVIAISLFIFAIEVITLGTVYLIGNLENIDANYDVNLPFYLDASGIFDMSKDKNIVVIVDDTFEGNYMNDILEKYPEYKEKLKDFIYFDNTTTASLMTYSSMPTLLTGLTCQIGNNLKENIKYCFDNSKLYPALVENNYEVDMYEDTMLIPSEDNGYISNKINKEVMLTAASKVKISSLLYECVAYKYFPHFLKKFFYIDYNEFNRVSAENEIDMFFADDVVFNKRLILDGIETNKTNKAFKFYHLEGLHLPYNVTRDIEYDNSKEYRKLDSDIRLENQEIASLNILCNYIEELKNEGIYDNTTIYFLADHGFENRYYVAFLVKPENSNNDEMTFNSAPISVLEDFIPTIINQITDSKDAGKDIWDYSEKDSRTRTVLNYTFTRGDNTYNVLSETKIQTDSHAKDYNSYKIVESIYSTDDTKPQKEYEFGSEINFEKPKSINMIGYKGILDTSIRTIRPGTNLSNKAELSILRKSTDKDVNATIDISEVYYTKQRIIISVNDKTILEKTLDPENENNTISFIIPKDTWNEKDIVNIQFEFPDCKLGDANYLGEETIFLAVRFGNIVFDNK